MEKDLVPGSRSRDRKIHLRYPTAGKGQGDQASYAGVDMKKKRNIDPLISRIELVLDLGQFISYNQSWDFVHDLEDIKTNIKMRAPRKSVIWNNTENPMPIHQMIARNESKE